MTTTVSEMDTIVTVTQAAAVEALRMLSRERNPSAQGLRLYVEQGGCSGLQYGMVFDAPRAADLVSEQHGLKIFVDASSTRHLQGTVIDYSDDLNDTGFKLRNPNARSSCGCGKSFDA